MEHIKRKLFWPPKRVGFAWNKKNGFVLLDVLMAASISLLCLVPLLGLGNTTMRTYDQALSWQQAAMVAREMMEESRYAGDITVEKRVIRSGRTYNVRVFTILVESYRCYVVAVEDRYGRVFQCKRLEKI